MYFMFWYETLRPAWILRDAKQQIVGMLQLSLWRCSGMMVIALNSWSNRLSSGDCVVLLDKTHNSHSASLPPPRCKNGYWRI